MPRLQTTAIPGARACQCGCGQTVCSGRIWFRGHKPTALRALRRTSGPHPCACGCGKQVAGKIRWAYGHKPVTAMRKQEAEAKTARLAAKVERRAELGGGAITTLEAERARALNAVRRTQQMVPIPPGTYREVLHYLRVEIDRIDRLRALLVVAAGACQKLTEGMERAHDAEA